MDGFPWFVPLWFGLGLAGWVAFGLTRNAAWKRRWWPVYSVGAGAVFVVAIQALFPQDSFTFLMVPFVALIMLLNIRRARFCDECGRTVAVYQGWAPPAFCPRCDAPLRASST